MNTSNNRAVAIGALVIGTLIIIALFISLDKESKTVVNFFTLYGTFASIYGLVIAYLQIQSIKQTSQQTKEAVDKSLFRINQVLSISDISRANKVIQEIQSSILGNKHELALIRMKDLKQILIQVKYNRDLDEFTTDTNYNQNIIDLSIDISNINDLLLLGKQGINFSKVNQNLENLATLLSEFENALKFKKND